MNNRPVVRLQCPTTVNKHRTATLTVHAWSVDCHHLSFVGNVDGEYVPQNGESSESSSEEDGVDDKSDEEEGEDEEMNLSEVKIVA